MDTENSTANLGGIIARSRSRYKGGRPSQLTKSAQVQTEIPRQQLQDRNQGTTRLEQRLEFRGRKTKTRGSNDRDAPPVVPWNDAADESNYSLWSSTHKPSPNDSGALFDHHSLDNAVEASTQEQTIELKSSRRQALRRAQVEHKTNESGTERLHERWRDKQTTEAAGDRKFGLGLTITQNDHWKPPDEHLKGKDEIGEHYEHPHTTFSPTPQTLSEPFRISEQERPRSIQAGSYSTPSKPSTLQKRSLTHKQKRANVGDELKRTISAPMAVEPAETSAKPAFDAPISAVNAGERRVRVQFNESLLSIPVLPSTTPLDIICEASTQLSVHIDTNTNILLESFKQLGLERPLRRYEHVRDIMNSWDNDSQNVLNIVTSPTGGTDDDLDLKSVPQSQPGDTSVHTYHSNAPGTWDKRWITLRSDGQVVMTRNDGKDGSNICHISDFDIYIPIKRQVAKKIKPPKKYCFAVKSQQKSAMFLTTENFVHFFAAGDQELAMVWYKAVQGWRSWYLVNIMGKGQKDLAISGGSARAFGAHQSPTRRQQGRSAADHESQQVDILTKMQTTLRSPPIARIPVRIHSPPPISFPHKLLTDTPGCAVATRSNVHHRPSIIQHEPLGQAEQGPFAAQGLLGRTYTRRQNALVREAQEKAHDHGLLESAVGNDHTRGDNRLQRKASQRPKQKPLLDLTPKYQEPPQHQKKGRGFLPHRIPAGGLVEAAANPEPIVSDSLQAARLDMLRSRTGRGQETNIRQASIATERQGQDGTGMQTAKTEDRPPKEPFLHTTRPWAKGSLLDRDNGGDSASGPVINRTKRHEVYEAVGEGV